MNEGLITQESKVTLGFIFDILNNGDVIQDLLILFGGVLLFLTFKEFHITHRSKMDSSL